MKVLCVYTGRRINVPFLAALTLMISYIYIGDILIKFFLIN